MVVVAAWCVIAFGALLALAYYVTPAAWLDSAALHGFNSLERPSIAPIAEALANLCNPVPFALASAATIAIAFARRGARTAAAVSLLLVGANATSQTLKPLLAHHRELAATNWGGLENINDAAFPSGHATAAMALSVAALMIVPRAYRPLTAAIGMLFTIGLSFALLILQWHFPSDIVGGYLVATAWGLTTLAALRAVNARWPQRGTVRKAAREAINAPSPAAIAKGAIVLAAVAALLAASRADQIASFADRHTAALAVASAIAVAAAVLLAAVASISGTRHSR
jgi:membrane-associated phospholipid phosphatase